MNIYKKNFREVLVDAGVEKACRELGLQFEEIFINNYIFDEDKYKDYKWYVIMHSKVGTAIHAVPSIDKHDFLPWEEWFIYEGKLAHNILYTKKQDKCDGEFEGSADDIDHPKEVLQKKWYFYFDSSLIPKLLQN